MKITIEFKDTENAKVLFEGDGGEKNPTIKDLCKLRDVFDQAMKLLANEVVDKIN